MIYMDHAATTPVHPAVLERMLPFFSDRYANPSAVYRGARQAHQAMDAARRDIASCIGAQPSEIYITSGGSESDTWAIFGAAKTSPRRRIVVSSVEHHAVINSANALQAEGYVVDYLPVDENGSVLLCEAKRLIDENTALVSVMTANNEVGTLQPVKELAQIAHAAGALMHTDAVQAAGHIPLNVKELDVDLLSLSAHKFGGPKGIGVLYIRTGVRLKPLIYGGAQERGLRPGTENLPLILGMSEALRLSVDQMQENAAYVGALRDCMQREITRRLPFVRINAANAERLSGHLHLSVPDMDASMLLMRLDMEGIAASSASACEAGSIERSHVIRAMGLEKANQAELRLTLGPSNTKEEVEKTVCALERILMPD